jgi:hypothetical protein
MCWKLQAICQTPVKCTIPAREQEDLEGIGRSATLPAIGRDPLENVLDHDPAIAWVEIPLAQFPRCATVTLCRRLSI